MEETETRFGPFVIEKRKYNFKRSKNVEEKRPRRLQRQKSDQAVEKQYKCNDKTHDGKTKPTKSLDENEFKNNQVEHISAFDEIISSCLESDQSSKISGRIVEKPRRWNSEPDITGFWRYTDDSGDAQIREIVTTMRIFSPAAQGVHNRQQERRSSLALPMLVSSELSSHDRKCNFESLKSNDESCLNPIEKVNARVMLEILRWKLESGSSIFPVLSYGVPIQYQNSYITEKESVVNKVFSKESQAVKNFEIPVRKTSSSRDLIDTGYSTAAKSAAQTQNSTNGFAEIGNKEIENALDKNGKRRKSSSIHLTVRKKNPLPVSKDSQTLTRAGQTLAYLVVLALVVTIITLITVSKS